MKRVFVTGLLLAATTVSLQGCFSVPVIAAAGVGGAAVMVAQDRRANSVMLDDQAIENKAMTNLKKVFSGNRFNVNVTSFNHSVLITGQVPNAADRQEIARIVASVQNVRLVYNQLTVGVAIPAQERNYDAYITSDVKMGLVRVKDFHSDYVKVVTEAGAVFLMGLVTREEGRIAADVASTTGNVQRVVKLFEYID